MRKAAGPTSILERMPFLDRLRGRDDEGPPLVEGLLIGALVGAAIAGSTLWNRFHSGRERSSATQDPATDSKT